MPHLLPRKRSWFDGTKPTHREVGVGGPRSTEVLVTCLFLIPVILQLEPLVLSRSEFQANNDPICINKLITPVLIQLSQVLTQLFSGAYLSQFPEIPLRCLWLTSSNCAIFKDYYFFFFLISHSLCQVAVGKFMGSWVRRSWSNLSLSNLLSGR